MQNAIHPTYDTVSQRMVWLMGKTLKLLLEGYDVIPDIEGEIRLAQDIRDRAIEPERADAEIDAFVYTLGCLQRP